MQVIDSNKIGYLLRYIEVKNVYDENNQLMRIKCWDFYSLVL